MARAVLLFLVSMVIGVAADMNGMDMSMDGAMALASGNMLPYLHFTLGDTLWFQGWVPQSAGAMVGACIGLFLLALVARWISACRSLMEAHWRAQAQIILANKMNTQRQTHDRQSSTDSTSKVDVAPSFEKTTEKQYSRLKRLATPFIPSHDIPRGILYAGQAALEYAFMLAIMTYQVGFIASIIVGLGVGETLFGRYNVHAHPF